MSAKIIAEFGRFKSGGYKPTTLKKRLQVFFCFLKEGRLVWRKQEEVLIPISPDDPKFKNAPYSIALITHPKVMHTKTTELFWLLKP